MIKLFNNGIKIRFMKQKTITIKMPLKKNQKKCQK